MEFSQSIDVSTETKLSGRFHFAPVIHWINHYPADKFKNNQLRYPQWIVIYPVDRPQAPAVQKVDNAGGPTPYPLIVSFLIEEGTFLYSFHYQPIT